MNNVIQMRKKDSRNLTWSLELGIILDYEESKGIDVTSHTMCKGIPCDIWFKTLKVTMKGHGDSVPVPRGLVTLRSLQIGRRVF